MTFNIISRNPDMAARESCATWEESRCLRRQLARTFFWKQYRMRDCIARRCGGQPDQLGIWGHGCSHQQGTADRWGEFMQMVEKTKAIIIPRTGQWHSLLVHLPAPTTRLLRSWSFRIGRRLNLLQHKHFQCRQICNSWKFFYRSQHVW